MLRLIADAAAPMPPIFVLPRFLRLHAMRDAPCRIFTQPQRRSVPLAL
jgi:hypothetical protein